jgi:hypothetical protein
MPCREKGLGQSSYLASESVHEVELETVPFSIIFQLPWLLSQLSAASLAC